MQDYVSRLRLLVEKNEPRLLALSDAATGARPGPGKWSPREVLGHLIDSASNNHQRFVRAQSQDHLVFAGYDQEAWVELQNYANAPWKELVALWRGFNLHLARVMEATPERVRLRPRAEHNLDQIAWGTVAAGEPATLDFFMADYVGHFEHHLRQILGEVVEEGRSESRCKVQASHPRGPMNQSLGLVSLVVRDYDEALAFFVGTLGFRLVEDSFVPEQSKRWVVVSPPGARESQLLLARASTKEQESHIGAQTGGRVFLFLYTDDFWRDYESYKARGVVFVRDPKKEPYGTVAVFQDLYGNMWDLLQPTESHLRLRRDGS